MQNVVLIWYFNGVLCCNCGLSGVKLHLFALGYSLGLNGVLFEFVKKSLQEGRANRIAANNTSYSTHLKNYKIFFKNRT